MIKYLKSKTVWASIVMMLLTMVNAYFEIWLDPAAYAAFSVVYGNLIIYLRGLTTQPLEQK